MRSPEGPQTAGGVKVLAGPDQRGRWLDYGFLPPALSGSGFSSDRDPTCAKLEPMGAYCAWGKRLLDVLVGSVVLLAGLPVLLIAAVLIHLEDGGPAFFIQRRVGLRGRPFKMYKLRTMVRDAEALGALVERRDPNGRPIYKSRDDVRVTKIGRFLRRLSIDELPQLLNVLKGEMSLVGPRPELTHIVPNYEAWQVRRLAVLPGITGWWQVTGRSDKPMHLHTEADLYYIRHYSLWLDLEIMLRTVPAVLVGRGAY